MQLVTQVFNGVTASFGNIITVESKETIYKRFKLLYFFNYLIFSFFTVSVGVIIQPFMKLWMHGDPNSLFADRTVVLLLCYFYVFGIRRVILMAKDSAGLYRQDQWFAILEAVLNIVMSVVFTLWFKSVDGIILANILSMLIIPLWTQPYLVYKYVLEAKLIGYYVRYVIYFAMTAGLYVITSLVANKLTANISNLFVELIVRGVLCVAIPNLMNVVVFARTQEFKDLLTLLLGVVKKKTKKG